MQLPEVLPGDWDLSDSQVERAGPASGGAFQVGDERRLDQRTARAQDCVDVLLLVTEGATIAHRADHAELAAGLGVVLRADGAPRITADGRARQRPDGTPRSTSSSP